LWMRELRRLLLLGADRFPALTVSKTDEECAVGSAFADDVSDEWVGLRFPGLLWPAASSRCVVSVGTAARVPFVMGTRRGLVTASASAAAPIPRSRR